MVDISAPFVKSSFHIQFVSIRTNYGVKNRVLENEPRAIPIRIILRNENLEPEHSFLVNALTDKNDAKPTCK